jgi:hypothetical protein
MRIRSILFLFALALPVFAGPPKPADEKAVLAAEKQLVAAMIKADAAALEKLLGDDLSYTHSAALTETKPQVLQVIKSGSTKYDAIEFNDTKVRQYGNVVITNHKMTIKNPPNAVNKLYVTMVWAKQSGGWQLVNRQATKLPD